MTTIYAMAKIGASTLQSHCLIFVAVSVNFYVVRNLKKEKFSMNFKFRNYFKKIGNLDFLKFEQHRIEKLQIRLKGSSMFVKKTCVHSSHHTRQRGSTQF